MSRRDKRRRLILFLAAAAVLMGILYPFLFPQAPNATDLEKAHSYLRQLVYICVIILDLGVVAITGAREVRDVFEEYRERKRRALELLLDEVARIKTKGNGNAKPLE